MPLTRGAPSRLALVVLGSHRSGTSAITRVLSLAGATLPARIWDPVPGDNPTGFWEPRDATEFDDRVLERLGSSWSDVFGPRRAQGAPVFDAASVEEARSLIGANYGDAELIVFKDPRATLVADLWKAALQEAGYQLAFVIPVRNPLEVAQSLQARDGFTRNRGLLLWTSYMLAAERATRGERRVFVAFDSLLANPEAALDRIERKLAFRFPRRTWDSANETEAFLRTDLKRDAKAPLYTLSGPLEPVRKLYDHLQAAAEDAPENEDITAEVGDWFGALEQTLAPVLKQVERDARRALSEQAARLSELQATSGRAAQEAEAALAELQTLQNRLSASEERLGEAHHRAEDAHRQLSEERAAGPRSAALQAELERVQSELRASSEARQAAEAHLAELQSTLDQALQRGEDGARHSRDLEAAIDAVAVELTAVRAAEAALTAELGQTRETLDAIRRELADAHAHGASLAEDLGRAQETERLAEARANEAAEQLRVRQMTESDDAAAAERARRDLASAEAQLQQERALVDTLRQERDAAAAQLSAVEAARKALEAQAHAAEEALRAEHAALDVAMAERGRLLEAEGPLRSQLEASQRAATEADRQLEDALRTVDERTTIVESALRIARRRSAETEELLQQRITTAQAETRDARLALAAAVEARTAAEGEAVSTGERVKREADARLHEERVRYAAEDSALRDRLAETGVAAAAAQARMRDLQVQLDDARTELAAERNRSWLSRIFGR